MPPNLSIDVQRAFVAGRAALGNQVFAGAKNADEIYRECARRYLWLKAFLDAQGRVEFFIPGLNHPRWRHRFEAIGLDPTAKSHSLKATEPYLKTICDTFWYLDLRPFASVSEYLDTLTPKAKKRLKYLDNLVRRESIGFVPIDSEAMLEKFFELYLNQWPQGKFAHGMRPAFTDIFMQLQNMGVNRSRMMVDSEGRSIAAMIGFDCDYAFNLLSVARRVGHMENLSPGLLICYLSIKELITTRAKDFYLLGAGDYEYKRRLGAQALPIYRFEKICLANTGGLLRLVNKHLFKRRQVPAQTQGES